MKRGEPVRLLRLAGRVALGAAVTALFWGFCLLVLWQVAIIGLADGPVALLAVAAGGVVGGLAALVLHELGHAAAGRLAGLPPWSLTLVFVRVDWHGGPPRLRPNADWFRPAAVAYHAFRSARLWQIAALIAGGPLASLLAGAACLAGAAAVNPGPTDAPVAHRSRWRDVAFVWPGHAGVAALNVAGLISLFLGAGTLVPGRAAGLQTDGGQLLDLALGRWVPSAPPAGPAAGGTMELAQDPAGADP